MKTEYICEKCGCRHNDWESAYKCESSHASAEVIYSWELEYDSDLIPILATYRAASPAPSTVYLKCHVTDDNGFPEYDNDGRPVYIVYPFKRLAHDDICDEIVESMARRWNADQAPIEENVES